ncbi:MAG: hydroxymethylpyrimidine/phosphomethylpyrimidine kinase [Candidatus Aminicenantes bacterium]|nr:hydroxymethylpyrimidine/phosphomethylpyrimidine kinase [Candidatus Aminicenantes bacterium]
MSKQEPKNNISISSILTLAGFDGTGGAGISTDIKVCSFLKVPNVSVVTCVVIQNPLEVKETINIKPEDIKKQILILKEYYDIRILNIGLFGEPEILDFCIPLFPRSKIIFDPILASGSGGFKFVPDDQIKTIRSHFKDFFLLTPNISEAETLSGQEIQSLEDVKKSAIILKKMGAQNILIKGGHLEAGKCYDTLYSQDKFITFCSSRKRFRIHGTGSFLNAGIAAYTFLGADLNTSIKKSKRLLRHALRQVINKNPILVI